MLRNLHVKNLALIDETEIEFGNGLNILSGETGAGKSLLLGSVNLAMGGRANKDLIREGADYALVELLFTVDSDAVKRQLEDWEIEPEEGEILLARKVQRTGRSMCRINGETVSADLMRKVASLVLTVHGQHEHEALLIQKNHLSYLDAFCRAELKEPLSACRSAWEEYQKCRHDLKDVSADSESRMRELSFLEFEIAEIEAAQLKPGEDEVLETAYRRLLHAQKIQDAYELCREQLGSDGGASEAVGRAVRALSEITEYDEGAAALYEQLNEIDLLLADFCMELSPAMDAFGNFMQELTETEERLNEINRLKSKYGSDIEKILSEKEKKEERVAFLQDYEAQIEKRKEAFSKAEKRLLECADRVHAIREAAVPGFREAVESALSDLNFEQIRFETEINKKESPGENGYDEVRFLLAANPGEPMRPLEAVASGGELSRIMLGLKTILAQNDSVDTMIFDEIDTGISGFTAQKVAEKLKQVSHFHQVLCITHLPQIAAMADRHCLIEKAAHDGRTISTVRPLDEEESIQELGRMLGGAKITESVLNNARELKEMAGKL